MMQWDNRRETFALCIKYATNIPVEVIQQILSFTVCNCSIIDECNATDALKNNYKILGYEYFNKKFYKFCDGIIHRCMCEYTKFHNILCPSISDFHECVCCLELKKLYDIYCDKQWMKDHRYLSYSYLDDNYKCESQIHLPNTEIYRDVSKHEVKLIFPKMSIKRRICVCNYDYKLCSLHKPFYYKCSCRLHPERCMAFSHRSLHGKLETNNYQWLRITPVMAIIKNLIIVPFLLFGILKYSYFFLVIPHYLQFAIRIFQEIIISRILVPKDGNKLPYWERRNNITVRYVEVDCKIK